MTRTRLALSLALGLTLSLALPGSALAEGLQVYGSLGLGSHFRADAWTPLVIHTRNNGPSFSGTLRFGEERRGDIDTNATTFEKRIELPRHSRKRVTLFVRIASPGRYVAKLEPAGGGGEALTIPFNAELVAPEDRFVALLGPGGGSVRGLADHWKRDKRTLAELVVTRLSPQQVSDRREAFEGLDQVMWLSPSEAPLEAAQLEALLGWVATGGHLVLVAGEDWTYLRDPALADALPMELTERVGPPDGAVPELPFGAELVRGALGPRSAVVVGTEEWPLLVRGRHGIGRVDLMTFHPEARRYRSMATVRTVVEASFEPPGVITERRALSRIEAIAASAPSTHSTDEEIGFLGRLYPAGIESHLSRLETLQPIPLGWLLALMGLYVLCIGPIDYFVLKRMGRLELTWITFPATIAVFTGLVYGLSHLNRSATLVMSGLEVVDISSDDPRGRVEGLYGLVSPLRTQLEVSASEPGGLLDRAPINAMQMGWAGPGPAGGSGVARSIQDEQATLELPIRRWSIAYARLRGPSPVDTTITARLVPSDDGGIALAVASDLDVGAVRAHLVARERVWDLGTIELPGDDLIVVEGTGRSLWEWLPTAGAARWVASVGQPTWPLPTVTALSYRSGAERVLERDPEGARRWMVGQMRMGWGAGLDLGPEPAPMLFLDGGPLDAPAVETPGYDATLVGRRIYRIQVDETALERT